MAKNTSYKENANRENITKIQNQNKLDFRPRICLLQVIAKWFLGNCNFFLLFILNSILWLETFVAIGSVVKAWKRNKQTHSRLQKFGMLFFIKYTTDNLTGHLMESGHRRLETWTTPKELPMRCQTGKRVESSHYYTTFKAIIKVIFHV